MGCAHRDREPSAPDELEVDEVLLGGFLMFPAVENADWWNVFALLVWAAAAIITAVAVRDAVDGSR